MVLLDLLCHESACLVRAGANLEMPQPTALQPGGSGDPVPTTALGVRVLGCLVTADRGLSSAEVLVEASRCSSSPGMLGAEVLRSRKRPRPAGAGLVGAGCGGSRVGCLLPSC